MSTTVSYSPSWGPDVTVTVDDAGGIECVLTIDELEPTRETSADERAMGISSLDPPTISVRARSTRYDTHRALLDASALAVSASAQATDGASGGPGGLLIMNYRVKTAIRHALRLAGEDI